MFYLFLSTCLPSFRRSRFLLIPLLVFVVLGPFVRSRAIDHNPVWREYSYLGGMDAIALGCLTALFIARRRFSRTKLWTIGSLGSALLLFSLGFSIRAYSCGLGSNGLNMTILAAGACMVTAAVAQTHWQAPRILRALLKLDQRRI